IAELCGTGYGNCPPAMNCAGWPSSAIRFGSARILAIELERRASMKSEKWAAWKIPKRFPVFAALAAELNLEATGWTTPRNPDEVWVVPPVAAMLAAPPTVEPRILLFCGFSQLI